MLLFKFIHKPIINAVTNVIDKKIANFRHFQEVRPDLFQKYQSKIITLSDLKEELSDLFLKPRKEKVWFPCPYTKSQCTELDTASATLLTPCTECENYNDGIVVSKF